MYQIEKDVPIPERHTGRGNRQFPFPEMQVGDSFFVPLDGRIPSNVQQSIAGAGRQNRTMSRFTSRQVTENGVQGVRCWRFE